jgi:hypothetical protein
VQADVDEQGHSVALPEAQGRALVREQCLLLRGPRGDGSRRVVADESAGVGGDAVQPGRIGLHGGVAYEVVIGDGADGIGAADEERCCQGKDG